MQANDQTCILKPSWRSALTPVALRPSNISGQAPTAAQSARHDGIESCPQQIPEWCGSSWESAAVSQLSQQQQLRLCSSSVAPAPAAAVEQRLATAAVKLSCSRSSKSSSSNISSSSSSRWAIAQMHRSQLGANSRACSPWQQQHQQRQQAATCALPCDQP